MYTCKQEGNIVENFVQFAGVQQRITKIMVSISTVKKQFLRICCYPLPIKINNILINKKSQNNSGFGGTLLRHCYIKQKF